MPNQPHNLGYLRMAVEDALVSYLTTLMPGDCTVRAAWTSNETTLPVVSVSAPSTREHNPDAYVLARYLDVEIRLVTYAEASGLKTAREKHFEYLSVLYSALAQSDIVDALNALGQSKVVFWSCYAKTDEGSIANNAYVSTLAVEIGASPQEI